MLIYIKYYTLFLAFTKTGCTSEQYERLVAGDVLRNEQFQIMKKIHDSYPGLVDRCLSGNCRYSVAEALLQDGVMAYWNALYCVKHNVGCPVKGGWSRWSMWSSCTALCGEGSRFHSRNCSNPMPSVPHLKCEGLHYESLNCTGVDCAPKMDGIWSDWKPWSECSEVCGPGVKHRVRDCLKVNKHQESKENVSSNQSLQAEQLLVTSEKPVPSTEPSVKYVARSLSFGSSCLGPGEDVAECENKKCSVNGDWSVWEEWSPCSALCGVGGRSRSRSCSNPIPWGDGTPCVGPVTEVQKCFKRPCSVKTHRVAMFTGDGSLLYSATGRPSRLLLLYLRFFPQMANGLLVTRFEEHCQGWTCNYVKLALEGRFLVLTVQVSGCQGTVISVDKIELGQWHMVLATVTGVLVTLRVDDKPQRVMEKLNCVPVMPELDQSMRIGENFHGQIQRISVNYAPVRLYLGKGTSGFRTGAAPYASTNVRYDVAEEEEGFRQLMGKEMLHTPCPDSSESWQIALTVRLSKADGILILMSGATSADYLLLTIETGHVHLRVRHGEEHTEAMSSQEIMPGQWLLVDMALNVSDINLTVNGEHIPVSTLDSSLGCICTSEMLIGDIPVPRKTELEKMEAQRSQSNTSGVTLQGLIGALGSLEVDEKNVNLGKLPAELEAGRQLSSYSTSLAEVYEEVPLILGRALHLTCFYGKHIEAQEIKNVEVLWLHLDQPIPIIPPVRRLANEVEFSISTGDDLARLSATSYPSRAAIEGFYSCWILPKGSQQRGRNLIGYGVTVVQFDIEFNNVQVNAVILLAAMAVLACFVALVVCAVQMKWDRNEKFGLYRELWHGKPLSPEEEVDHIMQRICSQQGQTILGSKEAMLRSQAHLLTQYDTKNLSPSDRELPPLPDSEIEERCQKSILAPRMDGNRIRSEEYTSFYSYNTASEDCLQKTVLKEREDIIRQEEFKLVFAENRTPGDHSMKAIAKESDPKREPVSREFMSLYPNNTAPADRLQKTVPEAREGDNRIRQEKYKSVSAANRTPMDDLSESIVEEPDQEKEPVSREFMPLYPYKTAPGDRLQKTVLEAREGDNRIRQEEYKSGFAMNRPPRDSSMAAIVEEPDREREPISGEDMFYLLDGGKPPGAQQHSMRYTSGDSLQPTWSQPWSHSDSRDSHESHESLSYESPESHVGHSDSAYSYQETVQQSISRIDSKNILPEEHARKNLMKRTSQDIEFLCKCGCEIRRNRQDVDQPCSCGCATLNQKHYQ